MAPSSLALSCARTSSSAGPTAGAGAAEARARASRFSIRSSRIFSERASAEADLLTSCLITASRLVILRRRPFSVIVTDSFSASFSRVVRFFEPGGRPARVAGLALLEAGIARRLAVTHFVIAPRPRSAFCPLSITGVWYKEKCVICQYRNCVCRTKIAFRCYSIVDRDRGTPRGATPPTPPGVRVTYHGGSTGLSLDRDIETGETE